MAWTMFPSLMLPSAMSVAVSATMIAIALLSREALALSIASRAASSDSDMSSPRARAASAPLGPHQRGRAEAPHERQRLGGCFGRAARGEQRVGQRLRHPQEMPRTEHAEPHLLEPRD